MARETGDRAEPVGARPVETPPAKRGLAARLGLLALLVLAVIAALLLLSRCGDDETDETSPAGAVAPTGSTASSPSASAAASSVGASGAAGSGSGTITAEGTTLFPLSGSDPLAAFTGQRATTSRVTVESVPADEGFWVGSDEQNRVWVQLSGDAGESPFTVEAGDGVAFTGTVAANAADFTSSVGVTSAEGAALLDSQGQHIAVKRSDLKLAP